MQDSGTGKTPSISAAHAALQGRAPDEGEIVDVSANGVRLVDALGLPLDFQPNSELAMAPRSGLVAAGFGDIRSPYFDIDINLWRALMEVLNAYYFFFLVVTMTLTRDREKIGDLTVVNGLAPAPPPKDGKSGKSGKGSKYAVVKSAIDAALAKSMPPGRDPPKYNDIHDVTIQVPPKPEPEPPLGKLMLVAWEAAKKEDGEVVVKDQTFKD